jgi:hypothetical protein
MAKKKTTEAINREQEVMEEKEALPSFFTNLFSSASKPLPNREVLEYNIMHSAPVKTNTEGYRSMTKVDKRTAEDIKHRLPCITPSVQLKGSSKKLTDFRKETYWLMLDYDAGRRKIHQLADRLRLQANFWNSNEQGFAHLLPQQLV